MKNITIMAMAIILIIGCKATKQTAAPSQADVTRVEAKFPGYTLADLESGKKLYEDNCGTCHGLKDPKSHNESEWYHWVSDMSAKVNKRAPGTLDENKEQLIARYLIAMSER